MSISDHHPTTGEAGPIVQRGGRRLVLILGLAVAELFVIMVAYQLLANVHCKFTGADLACTTVRSIAGRLLALLTVLGLYLILMPSAYHALTAAIGRAQRRPSALALNLAGLIIALVPLLLFGPAGINAWISPTLILICLGGGVAGLGGLLALMPLRAWLTWLRGCGISLTLALMVALVMPDITRMMEPIWNIEALTSVTFILVTWVLEASGATVWSDAALHLIRVDGFLVEIGEPCSGVEGFALVTTFMGLYALLMGRDIRQTRYWLVLFPAALLLSWAFNIVRIAILILIGAWIAPEHAVNGFHSYAGWLMFTLLALLVLAIAHRSRWLQSNPEALAAAAAELPPMRADMLLASIIPFIVMMLSGVLVSAIWADPAQGYPLRAAMMAAAVFVFWPALRQLAYRPRPIDIAAGAAIAAVWIVMSTPDISRGDITDERNALWIGTRLLGTIILVPIIEELFFRGYLLRRMAGQGQILRAVIALLITSALFGLMHDRFALGMAAGAIFGALYLRGGGLSAAILAHMVANALIAYVAFATGNWALI
ncbi:exosortase E/protease, VPEID-CTERM system [Phaeobacter gallaeciensis]|uniref:Exosortase E/protease, VPEID-CTERM system n=1 Tax=Phaeobacter gallaeciensis TaxID=60890 RepID=A0AAC9Z5U3_9RHOB|nr:exosortase E/protease, VPEID-CTERM system [Phaeobacter gallaeciensis]AHD07982.1 exosortase E/protease, VPEID-CTERM system [Phaeobacter gallaeciensis DSM 26640]ATE91250.1 exosortase E/protease, VPEID-CTERM system [Phaeobacter gallaeciensis]ATE95525.1 exosortase E/protease, VPEID-CTERM system [Phaeobacter gallaeciensis]ATE99864.1 exosortase E/protease, VPEID-CTERM system [Phaeobacter gallaeciensis]ATF04297.1 exosortase E/protease, VPEID-CTERM system [Phaeobacter gallaeciensis]